MNQRVTRASTAPVEPEKVRVRKSTMRGRASAYRPRRGAGGPYVSAALSEYRSEENIDRDGPRFADFDPLPAVSTVALFLPARVLRSLAMSLNEYRESLRTSLARVDQLKVSL